MDHENERWIKVYTRDTGGWLELSWQARGLALEISRKLDAEGRLPLGRRGIQSLAGVVRGRWEDLRPFVDELLTDGRFEVLEGNVLWDPEHKARQSAVSSPALRKKLQRYRDALSRDVTRSHATSRDVTRGHECHDQIRSEEIRSEEIRSDQIPQPTLVKEPVVELEAPEPEQAKHRYRRAYCAGISAAKGSPFAWPSGPAEKFADQDLGNVIATFAFSQTTAQAHRGEKLLGWIEAAAADFAEHVMEGVKAGKDDPKYWSSYNPKGLLRFLNQDAQATEARDVG